MKKTNQIIVVVVVVIIALLLLGIGYAAIQNITLNIEGIVTADPSQSNFKVKYTGTPKVSDNTYVTAGITDDINATINVEGLTQKGQTVSAEYTVQNISTDISADLAVSTTNSNAEYFTLKSKLAKTSLTAGEATTLKVIVELTKTPIAGRVNSTIGVRLTAMPVEPGQEGTSEGINGSSQTPEVIEPQIETIADITNDNIGEYIDLGNNIVGTESTTDDWRILYKEGDTVYAILADYLPANQVPEATGLDTNPAEYPYGVWSETNRATLLSGLRNTDAWSGFTNGIDGATVKGSPTIDQFINSYNIKNRTELVYKDYPSLDSEIEDYSLYVPHNEVYEKAEGYWCTSPDLTITNYNWTIECIGKVGGNYCYYNKLAIRPVISLPSNISCSYVNGVLTVEI